MPDSKGNSMKKTTKIFTISKYLRFIFILLVFFVFALLIGILFGGLYDNLILGLAVGAVCGAILYIVPLCYYLIKLIALKNKTSQADKKLGSIENWKKGFFRGFGKISLSIDETEFFSDTLYTWNEARELVGKSVNYCIIGDTLIILNFIEQL